VCTKSLQLQKSRRSAHWRNWWQCRSLCVRPGFKEKVAQKNGSAHHSKPAPFGALPFGCEGGQNHAAPPEAAPVLQTE